MPKEKQEAPEQNTPNLTNEQVLAATNLELEETKARLRSLETQVAARTTNVNQRAALDPESLKHPNAFLASDGRTLYRYEIKGEWVIFPKPAEEMTDADYDSVSFRMTDNTSNRLPQNLTVIFKDPQWAGQWFNKKARSGYRVGYARSMGFVPAKIEDLESYFEGLNDADGAVEDHDLVLMKVHKSVLYAKLAEYLQDAKTKGGVNAYREKASSRLSPRDMEQDPYFLTPQATGERQGLGPVTHLPEINR